MIGSGHLMLGPVELPLAIVWLQVLVRRALVGRHPRARRHKAPWQARLVIVLRMLIVAVPQVSLAVGSSKVRYQRQKRLSCWPSRR